MVHSLATIATRDPDDGGDGDEALGSPSPEIDPKLGTCLLDRYRLEEVLGAGGSSVIYRGVHTTIGRTVAIKMLRPELVRNDETVTRFLREGRAACRIRHEHIVEATDFGVTPDGDVFLVMEYLEGEDLADLIEREGALPWPRALAIALQICEAIDAAHQAGVIHRDITLQNCFRVSRERNPDYVKVIDFGIAKMCDASAPSDEVGVTGNAEIFGTPEYMAPEQVRRSIDADARTDIYALGVVLYALVTGRLPLRGATALDTLVRQIYDAVEPPSRVVPGIPEELEAAILRALAKDPDARFQSMAELARALEAVPVLGLVGEQQTDEIALDEHALAGDRPITAYDLPSLADHDLRSETPAERLIGGSSRSWFGSRWSLAAMAACALAIVGLSAMDRETAAPVPVAPSEIASAAVVPEPVAHGDVPAPVVVEAPVRVEMPTSTPTLRDHGIAAADVAPPRVRAPKPTRRSARAEALGEAPLEDTTMRPSAGIVAPSVPTTPDAATPPSDDEDAIVPTPDAPANDDVPSDDAEAVDAAPVDDAEAVEVPAPPASHDADPFATTPDHEIEGPVGAPQ
jgi:eukaryotic-like serine/threonine-protein kinase